MSKNIKITERQYKMLMEMGENDFSYVSDNETKPYTGYNEITPDGHEDGETIAHNSLTTDELGKMETPQTWTRFRVYGNVCPPTALKENGVNITNKEDNTADDTGETDAFDSDKLEDPNRVQIPNMIQKRMQQFFDELDNSNLNPSQKSVILNQITPHLTSDSTTHHEQKKFSQKVQNRAFSNQDAKNIANTD